MYPQNHILIGILFSLMIFPIFGIIPAIVAFLSSFLIDFDHYTSYVFQNKSKRDFSLKKAFDWHVKRIWEKQKVKPFTFFHFVEILFIIFFIGIKIEIFLYVFLGFAIHIPFDIYYEIKLRKFRLEKYSLLFYLFNK